MRVLQYVKQFQSGYMRIDGSAKIIEHDTFTEIDGGGGIGIPTMLKAVEHSASMVSEKGIYALPIRNVGHTGRLGAFTELAAEAGCLMIVVGGGGRQKWRQVAPYGGRKAVLPTNPWSIAIPGGDRGPVVLDFATAMIAGGWLYAAQSADALLPSGSIIDAQGKPSRNPEDYFNGGAILPKGGPMGYGLAVMAEMIGEAMLGPVAVEANTLMITMDTHRYREPHIFQAAAEEILADLRASPAMEKNAVVEIPGKGNATIGHEEKLRTLKFQIGPGVRLTPSIIHSVNFMTALCPALDGLRLGVKFALHRSGTSLLFRALLFRALFYCVSATAQHNFVAL